MLTNFKEKFREIALSPKKKKVFLDTNALLLIGSEGIDIFEELRLVLDELAQICVMKGTLGELEKIIDKKTKPLNKKKASNKDSFNAKLGFIMIHQKKIRQIPHKEPHVDDAIISSLKEGDYVFTLDRVLQERVLAKHGRVISIRQKRLVLVEK